jgi:uncharacterized MAPEG superfamily protein
VSADEQRAADEALDRWQRVSMNDIENVFLGLIVIWVSALTVGFDSTEVAHIVLTVLFTACRVAHTVLYVFKISYGRSLAWLFGHFAILALLIVGLVNVF